MLERARPEDAEAILGLRERAARWLVECEIAQWLPGEVPLTEIDAQVAAGDWWVRREGEAVVGALRLLEEDPAVWGGHLGRDGAAAARPARPRPALYVHGLVVDRGRTGRGLGAGMLDWAGRQAARAARPELRLDCVESNARLRRYYADLGFTEVGRVEFDDPRWLPAVLLTRPSGRG